MCRMIYFNYSAMPALLALILLAVSVQTRGNSYYQNPDPKAPTEAPKESANVTCQDLGLLCPGEGSYECCDDLVCRAPIVGGVFFCLPPLVPDTEVTSPGNTSCREISQVCIPYGQYNCCKGLSCVATSPVNPAGAGVCVTTVVELPPTTSNKCQKEGNLCQTYGEYKCCPEFKCIDPRIFHYYPLPIDSTKVPPGGGVCIRK